MTIGNTAEVEILNCYFNATNITAPTVIAMSLHSADPGDTGASELANANAYARVVCTTSFPTASGTAGTLSNDVEIAFPEASGAWSAATHVGIWSSATYGAGNFIWGGAMTASKTATTGVVIRFPVGDVDITLD